MHSKYAKKIVAYMHAQGVPIDVPTSCAHQVLPNLNKPLFMINLVMATQGGIYIYYLISVYYTQWPLIFFGLLTVLSAAFSHGGKYLMKDLSDMSKLALNHFINSHLSVLYTTLIPIFLCVSLFIWKKIHENAQLVSTKIT